MIEDDTKSSKPRVVDLDAATVAVLRAWRKHRGSMALRLARDDALVFGSIEGEHRNGEHVSRQFKRDEARFRMALGEDAPSEIRLHDLRHSHATILQVSARAHPRRQPAARPRLAGRHDDRLRPRPAGQPAGSRRPIRPAHSGGRSMTSVNLVSRRPAKANYKPLTWGFNVSEGRHRPYVHDRHCPDHGVFAWCGRCPMSGGRRGGVI